MTASDAFGLASTASNSAAVSAKQREPSPKRDTSPARGQKDRSQASPAADTAPEQLPKAAAHAARLPPTTEAATAAVVPAKDLSMQIAPEELKLQIARLDSVAEAMQRLESAARTVCADWQAVSATVRSLAATGPLDAKAALPPVQLAGSDKLFATKAERSARREALAHKSAFQSAARAYISLVHGVRRTMQQQRHDLVQRSRVEIRQPTAALLEAIKRGEGLSTDLKAELQKTSGAFAKRFGDDLAMLRNGRNMDRLAADYGLTHQQLATARSLLKTLDQAPASAQRAHERSRGIELTQTRDHPL